MFENFYMKSDFSMMINVVWIVLFKINFEYIITKNSMCFTTSLL